MEYYSTNGQYILYNVHYITENEYEIIFYQILFCFSIRNLLFPTLVIKLFKFHCFIIYFGIIQINYSLTSK